MPKHKPCKAVLKRFRVTATGKLKFKRAGKSHLNSTFSGEKNRQMRKTRYVTAGDLVKMEAMLGRRLSPANPR